ncbi:hypothetical protein CROQUDRAFT_104322 [Cronartium quercuum f. sp. fusiforme G11]|uniref:Uncharacterized protein n=1 Tax=Cronartium quercuum f. sp. fusiforme G11 TaxID=708437 RepID=A0A9P6TF98_9BASI|nr:hypothetical protein CROQUDRAFT_104322 [Cronartium quercuum f. sp. fusiforme G11]
MSFPKRECRRIGSRQLATHRSKGDFHEHRSMLTHTRLGRVLNAEDWSVNDLIIVGWDWAPKRSEDGGISTDLSQIRWGWRSKANPITVRLDEVFESKYFFIRFNIRDSGKQRTSQVTRE